MSKTRPLSPQIVPRKTPRKTRARSLQRFGRALGKQVRRDLLHRMQTGDVLYARSLTCSRTVIVLRYAGEEMAFLYNSLTRRIVCFLPPGAPELEDWRQSKAAAAAPFGQKDGCS